MDAPIFPLTSSAMQLNRLSKDFRNQLNKKKLHSINCSPAVLISPGAAVSDVTLRFPLQGTEVTVVTERFLNAGITKKTVLKCDVIIGIQCGLLPSMYSACGESIF